MATSRIDGDLVVTGSFSASSQTVPTASITNSSVAAAANIDADKLQHLHRVHTDFGVDTDTAPSADKRVFVYRAQTAATIRRVSALLYDTGTSTDVKFDLLKESAGSNSESTVLSATIDFTNADTDNTAKTGSLSSTSLAAGDVLIAHMDYTSATGAVGPLLVVEIDENAS